MSDNSKKMLGLRKLCIGKNIDIYYKNDCISIEARKLGGNNNDTPKYYYQDGKIISTNEFEEEEYIIFLRVLIGAFDNFDIGGIPVKFKYFMIDLPEACRSLEDITLTKQLLEKFGDDCIDASCSMIIRYHYDKPEGLQFDLEYLKKRLPK